jgi:hypothetical protein
MQAKKRYLSSDDINKLSRFTGNPLSPTDIAELEKVGGFRINQQRVDKIHAAVELLVISGDREWDRPEFFRERWQKSEEIVDHLDAVTDILLEILKRDDNGEIDPVDEGSEFIETIQEMRSYFETEVSNLKIGHTPPNNRLRDVLNDLFSIYKSAGGKKWKVNNWNDTRQSNFIDFVWIIFQRILRSPDAYTKSKLGRRWAEQNKKSARAVALKRATKPPKPTSKQP